MSENLVTKPKYHQLSTNPAFTIVELLVVIVIIGILAAITIVSYTGISNKAVLASLQSDLTNASTQLKMFQTINSAYPTTISLDCATTPDTVTNKCLKLSTGNTITSLVNDYSVNNTTSPQTFSLTIKNTNTDTLSVVTDNSKPIVLVPAPLNPVADWIATYQGDHYGNFYDSVTKQYATVTRTTPKTIYDPATQHIYDIPANKLAVTPRSDGKNGAEATIEEGRTNYLTNSYGATNDGTAWADWSRSNFVAGAPTYSLAPGVYKNSAQRVQYTGVAGDVPGTIYFWRTKTTDFAVGETWTGSFYVKGSSAGVIIRAESYASTSSWGTLQSTYTDILLTQQWQRVVVTNANIPSGTGILDCRIGISSIHSGDTLDISIDAGQFEKGAFATSYIPTTAATVTRNADQVAIPQTNWSMNAGTVVGVAGDSGGNSGSIFTWWNSSTLNRFYLSRINASTIWAGLYVSPTTYAGAKSISSGYHTLADTWTTVLNAYVDGSVGTPSNSFTAPTGLNTANIGSYYDGTYNNFNGPISRFTVYSYALSDPDVLTVTNAVRGGP